MLYLLQSLPHSYFKFCYTSKAHQRSTWDLNNKSPFLEYKLCWITNCDWFCRQICPRVGIRVEHQVVVLVYYSHRRRKTEWFEWMRWWRWRLMTLPCWLQIASHFKAQTSSNGVPDGCCILDTIYPEWNSIHSYQLTAVSGLSVRSM